MGDLGAGLNCGFRHPGGWHSFSQFYHHFAGKAQDTFRHRDHHNYTENCLVEADAQKNFPLPLPHTPIPISFSALLLV